MNPDINGRDVRHHQVKFSQYPNTVLTYLIIPHTVSINVVTTVNLASIGELSILLRKLKQVIFLEHHLDHQDISIYYYLFYLPSSSKTFLAWLVILLYWYAPNDRPLTPTINLLLIVSDFNVFCSDFHTGLANNYLQEVIIVEQVHFFDCYYINSYLYEYYLRSIYAPVFILELGNYDCDVEYEIGCEYGVVEDIFHFLWIVVAIILVYHSFCTFDEHLRRTDYFRDRNFLIDEEFETIWLKSLH